MTGPRTCGRWPAPHATRRTTLQESALLADVGRWMPLGAIAILAFYCLTKINLTPPDHGVADLAGVATTVAVHSATGRSVVPQRPCPSRR